MDEERVVFVCGVFNAVDVEIGDRSHYSWEHMESTVILFMPVGLYRQ